MKTWARSGRRHGDGEQVCRTNTAKPAGVTVYVSLSSEILKQ